MTTHHDPRACECTLHTATPQVCPDPLDEEALFWHERWHEAADQRDARDAAAYAWKEAARRLSIRARARWSFCDFLLSERTRADKAMIRMSARLSEAEKRAAKAEQERSCAWEQLEHRDHELATAEAHRDEAQLLAAEQIAEAQSEATDAVTRAEKAEWERDNARHSRDLWLKERDEARARADDAERHRGKWREAATLWEKRAIKAENRLDDLHTTQPRPLTAREHLEAAWEAAHEAGPDGIPEGTEFICRSVGTGRLAMGVPAVGSWQRKLPASTWSGGELVWERRLLDPPERKRPEGAEELARLIANADVGEWDCGDLADALLATGRVRVTGGEDA